MVIDQYILDQLSAQAKVNPRLRQNYDLRNSSEDSSQRMLNALEPGTVLPIHRHKKSSESIAVIRGKMIMRIFNDFVEVIEEYTMEPNGKYPMIHIEKGQWHAQEALVEGTVVFTAKDGAFEPLGAEDILVK